MRKKSSIGTQGGKFTSPPPADRARSLTGRIEAIDALRGFCIILVVAYHFGYTFVARGIIPRGALYNPLLNILQPLFAGVFIVLAGVSSRFSRSNFKRGLLVLGCAGLVTAFSHIAGTPIWFGILHLIAACILLYALLDKLRLTIPAVLLAAFLLLLHNITKWPVLPSADYFPIVPWGFLFFSGVWLGGPILNGAFPQWFYAARIPVFPAIGRRTLPIYLLHQPVLYGALWIIGIFMD
jgi:uncharacterized membrane protein